MPESSERPLLVIDGDNLAHRAYHSMPKSLKSDDGRPINAIIGWTNMLVTIWENEQPRSSRYCSVEPMPPGYPWRTALWRSSSQVR